MILFLVTEIGYRDGLISFLDDDYFLLTGYYVRQGSSFFLGLLLAYLSIPVVQNLLSSKQMMNTSFDSLRIVNTYGAFGRYIIMFV